MGNALSTAYSVLPTLSREELRQLQSKISDMLRSDGDVASGLFRPVADATLEMELDAAIAEFDAGNGYSAEQMSRSIRERFGWAKP